MKSATLLSLALLTVGASANIFPTEPVDATTWTGGQKQTAKWKDDNVAPLLSALNSVTIELMTGTDTNQTSLSVVATNIKGTAGAVDYVVPKDLGPPGKFYFLRFNEGTTFVWSTRFNIVGITPPVPKATDPQATTSKATDPLATTTSKAPDAPKTSDAPKADAPKSTPATTPPAYSNPPKASAPTSSSSSPAAAAAAPTTTPTPPSASEAIGISPSSLMSIAMGGVAFIFTYLY